MIRVTVELLRKGSETNRETLGVAEIANVGGTLTRGDYAVRLLGKGGRAWKTGTVEGFPRLKLGGWDLLFRALGGIVAGRNPKVPFPEPWEKPVDGGMTLASAEETEPQAGGPEDARRKALFEALEAWAKSEPLARQTICRALRGTERITFSPQTAAKAIRVLELLGEVGS